MNTASPAYRYVICGCSCLMIFINVGLLSNAFSIYFPFIMEEHGFTNTQLSLLNTMRSITALGCMFCVSITIFAADFSSPTTYPKVLKNYQLTYTLGGLFSSAVPGVIADTVGSYVPAYILIFFCAIGILLFLIPVHRKYAAGK